MRYIATINTPGYSPQDDELHVFDTPAEAWEYLAEERERQWDAIEPEEGEEEEEEEEEEWDDDDELSTYARTEHGPDVVYGPTPGSDSPHDLGLAYSVVEVPRVAGRCQCCGDDVALMDEGYCCNDCTEAGCETSQDACGETASWECQRDDSLADTDDIGPQCTEGHPIGNCSKCDTATEPWYSRPSDLTHASFDAYIPADTPSE